VPVTISQAKDVSENGDGGCGAGVRQPSVEPFVGVLETLHEEVAEHGVEMGGDLLECFDAFFGALGLGVGDVFAAGVGFEVFGEVACVGGDEVLVQRDGVGHELDDAGGGGEGEDFVSSDTEVALTGGALGS